MSLLEAQVLSPVDDLVDVNEEPVDEVAWLLRLLHSTQRAALMTRARAPSSAAGWLDMVVKVDFLEPVDAGLGRVVLGVRQQSTEAAFETTPRGRRGLVAAGV